MRTATKCKLVIRDSVNVRFEGLDIEVRKKLNKALRVLDPEARHTPQFKLGRWDGTIQFFTQGGSTYFHLLDRVLPLLDEEAIELEVDDRRPEFHCELPMVNEHMIADRVWPIGHPMAGQPIILRDYQVEAMQRYFDNFQSLQSLATGSGKTILTACLSLAVERATGGRTLIIVPSKSLVVQTEDDYRNVGLDCGVFYGERKEWDRQHTICTWQSLAAFSRRKPTDLSIKDFLTGVVCVMIDEAHSARASVLRELLCGPMAHIPIRWGMTGTIPKQECDFLSLLSAIGPVVGSIRAATLQNLAVLADCDIRIVQTKDQHRFKSYDEEHTFLVGNPQRLCWLAGYIAELAGTGNTVVLVDRVETGKQLAKLLPSAVFLWGSTKLHDRRKEYDEVQWADDKLIIATYGIAAVGLNVPRLFNCVLVESGKSFTRVIQSVGRMLRRTQDKTRANIIDICSSMHFSRRHLNDRLEYYREAEYPFTVSEVHY